MSIGAVFDDAQRATHNHKSLAKRLRRLEAKYVNKDQSQEFEQQVRECILRLFEVAKSEPAGNRAVKFLGTYFSTSIESEQDTSAAAAAAAANKKAEEQQRRNQQKQQQQDDEGEDSMMTDAHDEEDREDEDNHDGDATDDSSHAVANAVLVALLPYLCAKDKTVRYRAIQLISTVMVSIDEIDDDLYKAIRHELTKRLRDRVPAIRLEAVLVLGPLVENELESAEMSRSQNSGENEDSEDDDADSDYDDESNQASGLLAKLLDVLQNDTNADVRRALLINLPITPETLPFLMERARDKDANTRRAFYAKVGMQRLGDFRHLGMSMREKLLRWGLRDRDERVRKATARMFKEKWIEDCARTLPRENEAGEEGERKPDKVTGFYDATLPALLELLERIDVVNTGAEGGMALDAMKEFWAGRPDYVEVISLGDDFWSTLRAESAFLARTWIDFCLQNDRYQGLLEEQMPEVTRFGFHLQKHLNELTEKIVQNEAQEANEEDTTEQEFVVEQLLHIAHTLDYTDEIGRRKMFSLLRNSIAIPSLPEECTKLAIEALRLTCNSDAAGEKEFTSVVLEAIAEVHDTVNSDNEEPEQNGADADDSFVSARSEVSHDSNPTSATTTKTNSSIRQPSKSSSSSSSQAKNLTHEELEHKRIREILTNLKCLSIAHSMLQNISGPIITNMNLEGMLESLIIPSVRSHDNPVRLKALSCLGLCCLIEPLLASTNWPVFERCLDRGDDAIKILSLQVFCDVLLVAQAKYSNGGVVEHDEIKFDIDPFIRALAYSSDVQNVATSSLGKLMLCGYYRDEFVGVFDDAVEEAERVGAKGWEVLNKVKMALGVGVGEGSGGKEKEKEL